MASNWVEAEQYSDFLFNTMFRQSIVCRADVELSPVPMTRRVLDMYVASPLKANGPIDLHSREPAQLIRNRKVVLKIADAMDKAVFMTLMENFPAPIQAMELFSAASARLKSASIAPPVLDPDRFSQMLFYGFAKGTLELWTLPPRFTKQVSARPRASPYTRLETQSGAKVTNQRHETIPIYELARAIACRLDGNHDREMLLNELSELLANGTLKLPKLTQEPIDPANVRQLLARQIETDLASMAYHALLLA